MTVSGKGYGFLHKRAFKVAGVDCVAETKVKQPDIPIDTSDLLQYLLIISLLRQAHVVVNRTYFLQLVYPVTAKASRCTWSVNTEFVCCRRHQCWLRDKPSFMEVNRRIVLQRGGGRGDCVWQSLRNPSNTGGKTAVENSAKSCEVLEQWSWARWLLCHTCDIE